MRAPVSKITRAKRFKRLDLMASRGRQASVFRTPSTSRKMNPGEAKRRLAIVRTSHSARRTSCRVQLSFLRWGSLYDPANKAPRMVALFLMNFYWLYPDWILRRPCETLRFSRQSKQSRFIRASGVAPTYIDAGERVLAIKDLRKGSQQKGERKRDIAKAEPHAPQNRNREFRLIGRDFAARRTEHGGCQG